MAGGPVDQWARHFETSFTGGTKSVVSKDLPPPVYKVSKPRSTRSTWESVENARFLVDRGGPEAGPLWSTSGPLLRANQQVDEGTMTDDAIDTLDCVDDEVRTNPALPRGWRLYRHGGTVFIAIEDAFAGCRNWFELEQEWLETQP
jgi:hypothetical protein